MKPVPVQTARRGRRPEGLPPVASTSGRGCRIFIPFAVEWRSSCRAVSAHRPVGGGMPAAECLVSEGSDVEIKRCGSAGLFVRCVANRRLRSASFGVCSVGGDFGPRDTYALRMIGALLCQSAAGEGRVGRHRRDDAALRMGRLPLFGCDRRARLSKLYFAWRSLRCGARKQDDLFPQDTGLRIGLSYLRTEDCGARILRTSAGGGFGPRGAKAPQCCGRMS